MPVLIAAGTFFALQLTCSAPVAVHQKTGLRIATYNIAWLGEANPTERLSNIKSVIKNLNPDIVALQEIASKKALERIFDGNWQIGIADEPSEYQELAIAVKKPLKIESYDLLFRDGVLDDAFPGKRDVLRAVVLTPSGVRIFCYVVHMKSRSGGRRQTDHRRIMACSLLAAYIASKGEDLVVALGDFNDTPDDQSVNILESGDLRAEAGTEPTNDPFLVNLTETLWAQDYCTIDLCDRYQGEPLSPRVKGARQENEKWRGKDYRFPDDLAMTQTMFDQILISRKMNQVFSGTVSVYSGQDALRGTKARGPREGTEAATYQNMGTLASDHLPVYADFRIPTGRQN